MATLSEVKRLRVRVLKFYKIKEVKFLIHKELKTEDSRNEYYESYDEFQEALNYYYSSYIMYLKTINSTLFVLYLSMNKQYAKDKLLNRIIKT